MQIRRATFADIPALVALNQGVQELHADAFPAKFRRNPPIEVVECAFNSMLQNPSSYWLVAEEGQPVAFLSAEFRDRGESWCLLAHRVCYLAAIAVASPFRRQGVARSLLAELQREALARGVVEIELDVWAFNEHAHQAFVRLGFRGVMNRMALAVSDSERAREQ